MNLDDNDTVEFLKKELDIDKLSVYITNTESGVWEEMKRYVQ